MNLMTEQALAFNNCLKQSISCCLISRATVYFFKENWAFVKEQIKSLGRSKELTATFTTMDKLSIKTDILWFFFSASYKKKETHSFLCTLRSSERANFFKNSYYEFDS